MILLHLRNELWKMFGKKRTYIGFGMFFLAQATVLLLLRYTHHGPRQEMIRRLGLLGYSADDFMSNLTMASFTLIPVAGILLPLYAALVGGDLLAKESEEGTLRMILSRPISRLRLVVIKWLAGSVFSIVLCIVLGISAVTIASSLFHAGGLYAFFPMDNVYGVFGPKEGWQRYVSAMLLLSGDAITIMSLALMFSCFNIKPAAATILALSLLLICDIVRQIPYFQDIQQYFITYHMRFWLGVFIDRPPWPDFAASLSILVGFNATMLIIGAVGFQIRDIKS